MTAPRAAIADAPSADDEFREIAWKLLCDRMVPVVCSGTTDAEAVISDIVEALRAARQRGREEALSAATLTELHQAVARFYRVNVRGERE